MAFDLKNSWTKYTRMEGKLFHGILGKSMQAYVDDMLVKIKEEYTHMEDLAACFQIMKEFNFD